MNKNIIIAVLAIILTATSFIGYSQSVQKESYKIKLENSYQNSFQVVLSSVKNIQATMSKALVSASSQNISQLLADVWRYGDFAQSNLGRLPISHSTLKNTEEFFNKLSDFAYAMTKINIENQEMSDDQWNDLERLKNSSTYLLQQLQIMEEQIQQGELTFGDVQKSNDEQLDEASDNLVTKGFTTLDKEMNEYPKLIYDGPFSDHIQDIKAKGINGEEITEKEGEEKAKEFLDKDNIKSFNSNGVSEGVIVTYVYDVAMKNEESAYIEISKIGGHVLKVMKDRIPEEQKMSMEEAKEKADEFLKDKGYENLVNTYYEKYTNVGVFNYAYTENDVIIYPDLIKVQIALDDGEMLGIEAQGFHFSHHERDIPEPVLSLDDARENVSSRLEITKERLAIIPTEFKTEVLCYEFKGTYKKDWYIIYINAETGKEEQILKIIEADESVLTL
ncbi:MAG: germination protein YpeB [Eubacteriaceae bacterium]